MVQVREMTYMHFGVGFDDDCSAKVAGLATARGETNAELVKSIITRGYNELMSEYSEGQGHSGME